MAFELPPLPYEKNALEPHMSGNTLDFHHGKHHQAYVTTTNKLIDGTDYEKKSLEDIFRSAYGKSSETTLFNQSAQVWNHTFFWNSMKPNGGGGPSGSLSEAINSAFGSLDGFKEKFKEAGTGQFGSGWAWLVKDDQGRVSVMKTPNAENPIVHGRVPLLTCDVWEHAYYLDYQNRRPDFIQSFLDNLVNWDFAAKNYG